MAHWIDFVKQHLPSVSKALSSLDGALADVAAITPGVTDNKAAIEATTKVALGVHVLSRMVTEMAGQIAVDPNAIDKAVSDFVQSMKDENSKVDADIDAKFSG